VNVCVNFYKAKVLIYFCLGVTGIYDGCFGNHKRKIQSIGLGRYSINNHNIMQHEKVSISDFHICTKIIIIQC